MKNPGKTIKDFYFSNRESQCIEHVLRGKTIKTIAKVLQLSPRTIEFYIKNIKNKLGCRTKAEIIEILTA